MDYYMMEDFKVDETDDFDPDREKKAVIELRKRVENEMTPTLLKDDTVYIRFLRARDGNINKATDMLSNHITWRKLNDIDNIIENYPDPEVLPYFPTSFLGFDKSGRPIRYNDTGKCDFKGILKSMKIVQLVKCCTKVFESDVVILQTQSADLGTTIDTWVHIFNFENFSFASATNKRMLQFFIHLVSVYEANFPERLHRAFIINASMYFTLLFNVIKPLLTSRTLDKIKIYGKDGWKEELLKNIDIDVLPVFLGGNRRDENGNPMCTAFVKHGCPVPESYYSRSYERRLSSQPDIGRMVVTRMSKLNIELDVKNVGDFIEWQFETESGDISFGLFMKVDGKSEKSTLKPLIPTQRVEAHIVCETGTYRCEEPGMYVLQFDNSHSWLRRKQIYYRVEVVKSSE